MTGNDKVAAAPASNDDPASNVDKIRDILFGGQMREYERRFAAIEERLFGELAQLRRDLSERLARMESELRAEAVRLGEGGLRERSERLEAQQTLELNLARLGDGLLVQMTAAEQRLLRQSGELRDHMATELQDRAQALAAHLSQVDRQLDATSAERSELATLFADIARRLGAPAG